MDWWNRSGNGAQGDLKISMRMIDKGIRVDNKKFVLGQYFTKKDIVERVMDLILVYKQYGTGIHILEPSFGTGNFVQVLDKRGYKNIKGCEIDPQFTKEPCDFFLYPMEEKFDLIIGNPPFTKYNVKESYYYPKRYLNCQLNSSEYLNRTLQNKDKMQIEGAFILKAIRHLKDKNSSIGFVLPISFFIAKKNREVKRIIMDNFKTIIIYQNDRRWFDEPIPCCFAIFTNLEKYDDKIILLYEDGGNVEEILDKKDLITEELIPKSFLYKKKNPQMGIPLSTYLIEKKVTYKKDLSKNNVSGSNILERRKIPENEPVSDYALAVARVGNASVGKAGLINIKEDVLNDMFYVLAFRDEFNNDKTLKEEVCAYINQNQDYFINSTIRVGSKSIKKADILNFCIKK